jgi:hypothetical protein
VRFLLASLLLVAACAPAPRVEAPQPVAVEAIAFRVSSWGKIVSDWQIQPSGTATYTYSEGPGLGSYRLITRKFDAGPAGFAQIRALLAPAERVIGAEPDCGERWTDFPYGTARWHKGLAQLEIGFDFGCHNPKLAPVHQALKAADKQMGEWAKNGQIIEDKEAHS